MKKRSRVIAGMMAAAMAASLIGCGAQVNRLELAVRSLAGLDGGRCGDISQILMTDGKNPYGTEAMANALAFYDQLVKDGSFHPNSVTMKEPEARALFAQNQAELNVLAEKTQAEWERAIDAAKQKGADVSAEDFEFGNWNPLENYTPDMYTE